VKISAKNPESKHTNDGDIVAGSLELPESDIDSDTALTLSLQFVKNPSVLEGTFAKFGSFLWSALAMCCQKMQKKVRKDGEDAQKPSK